MFWRYFVSFKNQHFCKWLQCASYGHIQVTYIPIYSLNSDIVLLVRPRFKGLTLWILNQSSGGSEPPSWSRTRLCVPLPVPVHIWPRFSRSYQHFTAWNSQYISADSLLSRISCYKSWVGLLFLMGSQLSFLSHALSVPHRVSTPT
jgi:hypothetical protein